MAYLVLFESNMAIDAVWTDASSKIDQYVDFDGSSGKVIVKSFYIDTEDKEQALQIASDVIKQIWGKIGLD